MAYPRIRWELSNGITGTFVIENPSPEFVQAMVTAVQNNLTVTIPEITAMPTMKITEVTYSTKPSGPVALEVWFEEPDGQ